MSDLWKALLAGYGMVSIVAGLIVAYVYCVIHYDKKHNIAPVQEFLDIPQQVWTVLIVSFLLIVSVGGIGSVIIFIYKIWVHIR